MRRLRVFCLLLTWLWAQCVAGAEEGLFEPGAVPGTVRLNGSATSFGIGGRFEGHVAWSDRGFGARHKGRDILYFPDIPLPGSGREGEQFRVQARQSRLWMRGLRPVGGTDIEAYVEWDMEENPDSYKLRLRHAFLSVGPLLIGRSYTSFINTAALPEIDSGVAPGEVITKREQLRWTGTVGEALELVIALEQPDSRVAPLDGQIRFRSFDDNHVPNLVGRLTRFSGRGEYSLAAMLRSLRWRGAGQRQSVWAGGVGFSGRFNVGGRDNLRLMLNYGNGLGRFVTLGSYADGYVDEESGTLSRNAVASLQAAYQHFWHEHWRSALSLGYSGANLPAPARPDFIKRTTSLQANLLFSPLPALSVGVEYLHGRKTLKDGEVGSLKRALFVTRYEIRF